jgi:hypothetical protein
MNIEKGWMLRHKDRPHRYIKGNASSIKFVEFNKAKLFTKAEYAYKLLDKVKEKYNLEVIYIELKIMTENDIVEKELLEA